MTQDINQKITVLQNRAVEYQKQIRSGIGPDKIAQLQNEFAVFISAQMGELVKNGASAKDIQVVQEILRAAFEPVPDSHARDITEDSDTDAHSEEDLANYESQTFLLAVDYELIQSFETGKLNKDSFVEKLSGTNYMAFDEMLEIIDLIICKYDTEESILGGEVIASPDGEALVINPLLFKQNDEASRGVIADPAVYQTESEAEKISNILSNISEKDFCNQVDIKKLIKADMFAGYEEKDLKKNKAAIEETALNVFRQLCDFYKTASKKCVLIISI